MIRKLVIGLTNEKTMKKILFLLLYCVSANADYSLLKIPSNLKNPRGLSLGLGYGCVIDDGKVKCWGKNNYESERNPRPVFATAKNPKMVSLNSDGACIIDDVGLKCEGTAGVVSRVTDPYASGFKNIKNPSLVKVGGISSCAIADKKVYCWGHVMGAVEKHVGNPVDVAMIDMNIFVLNDDGTLHCYGPSGVCARYESFTSLKNIKALSTGSANLCVITELNDVLCDYLRSSYAENPTSGPKFKTQKNVVTDYGGKDSYHKYWTCLIVDNQVKCFGVSDGTFSEWTIPAKNPKEIAIDSTNTGTYSYPNSNRIICIIDDNGLSCLDADEF